jgi:hypothetical protein
MAKYLLPLITLLIIALVISAGCISPPKPGSQSNNNQQTSGTSSGTKTTVKTTAKTTAKATPIPTPEIIPAFSVGQIALKSSGATTGLSIVDFNNDTKVYGTLEVKKDGSGNGWHTEGYQLIVWKPVSSVDKDYKFKVNYVVNPIDVPEYDPTKTKNVEPGTPCDLVGNWSMNKGTSVYLFRLDRFVVNKAGNKTYIGTWKPVNDKDGRAFVITWRYGLTNTSPNLMERITLSSDYSKLDSVNNYGTKTSGTWIGLIPSWKAELDKANPDKQAEIAYGADCYKWLGGGDWYDKV